MAGTFEFMAPESINYDPVSFKTGIRPLLDHHDHNHIIIIMTSYDHIRHSPFISMVAGCDVSLTYI